MISHIVKYRPICNKCNKTLCRVDFEESEEAIKYVLLNGGFALTNGKIFCKCCATKKLNKNGDGYDVFSSEKIEGQLIEYLPFIKEGDTVCYPVGFNLKIATVKKDENGDLFVDETAFSITKKRYIYKQNDGYNWDSRLAYGNALRLCNPEDYEQKNKHLISVLETINENKG